MKLSEKSYRFFIASTLLLTAFSSPSNAEIVSVDITAVVAYVDDRKNYLGGHIKPGDQITGTYIYDTTTPDTNTMPNVGDYRHTEPGFGVCLDAAGIKFRSNPDTPEFLVELVDNLHNSDAYLFHSYENTFDISVPVDAPYGRSDNMISWQLDDPTQQALGSVNLTNQPPQLNQWQSWFGLTIHSRGRYDDFIIRAHVTSAVKGNNTCATTPTPPTEKYIANTLLHKSANILDKTEAVLYKDNNAYTIATRNFSSGAPVAIIHLPSIANAKPIDITGLKDTNLNNYPDIALLYTNLEGKAAHIRIIDSHTHQTIKVINSSEPQSTARTLESVPDLNRNGFDEISVLYETPSKSGVLETIDSRTGSILFKRHY